MFIAFTDITITANLVACELIILTGVNGHVHNMFEVKSLNTVLLVSRGRLVRIRNLYKS